MTIPKEYSWNYRAPTFIDDDTSDDAKVGTGLTTPYSYRPHPENTLHTVIAGDTWASLAFRYYPYVGVSYPNYSPARLYRFLAMFQPTPAIDPFIMLRPGTVVVIPSTTLLSTEILGG